jgi:hypothetical protein
VEGFRRWKRYILASQRNPDLQGSCSLATLCSLWVKSEQNSSKLRHASRDVYRKPSAFSRVHCVTRLKGVRREKVNQACERSSSGLECHLTADVAECIRWIYALAWHINGGKTPYTSETITHWALARNRQGTVSHTCMTRNWLLHVQTASYVPPGTHICRLVFSHSLMQHERCGWQRNSENIFEFSVQKYIRNRPFSSWNKIFVDQCNR